MSIQKKSLQSDTILLGKTESEIAKLIKSLKLPSYIAAQIADWIYKKFAVSFESMTNIAKSNRELLAAHFSVLSPVIVDQVTGDNTVKYVLELSDGYKVECVYMKDAKHATVCLSSQVGCALGCKFCVTGHMGLARNLTTEEILAQYLIASHYNQAVTHVVFMGMGEPLMNYGQVFGAYDALNAPDGFDISKRRMVISTSGILEGIQRLINDNRFVDLALSVGNAFPDRRLGLMKVEKKNPIFSVVRLLKQYLKMHNRKLTLEYTLLSGINDHDDEIRELINMARFLNAKVNLINFNPHPLLGYEPVVKERVTAILKMLESHNIPATLRFSKGQSIAAACGQLGAAQIL